MSKKTTEELPVIQKSHDLILWYVPVLMRLPRDYRFTLGDRMIKSMYKMHDKLIEARYAREKLEQLQAINVRLERLRHQTRLLLDFKQIDSNRFLYASKMINEVGVNLGRWINQQKQNETTRKFVATGN